MAPQGKVAMNELSFNVGLMVNTINPATQYQSGTELHSDYMLGHYFSDDLGLGIAGSYYRQVSADTRSGAVGLAN